jgi:hypothetical protein
MDTAQAFAPAETDDPNAQIQQAANAFKAFTTGDPVEQPRNDRGQFAPVEELAEEEEEAGELAETEPEADEDEL